MDERDYRRSFSQVLLEQGGSDRNIVVVATDSRGSSLTEDFARALPDQFVEAGIAEQNAVAMAAGLALGGKNVFVCGPACFLSSRSAEQVKVDVAYNHTRVKIVGVSAGIGYGALGATHHTPSDLALMTSLPGLAVFCPSDTVQARAVARYLCGDPGPAYVRLGRRAGPDIYPTEEDSLMPGRINVLGAGEDGVLAAVGETVHEALAAARALGALGLSVGVLDCCCVQPFDGEELLRQARGKWVLTIEEHGAAGGLGDRVSRVLGPAGIPHERLCFPDEYAPCAGTRALRKRWNLDARGIVQRALALKEALK